MAKKREIEKTEKKEEIKEEVKADEVKVENSENPAENSAEKTNQNKQLKWIIGLMVIIIGGVLIGGWLSIQLKNFEYIGFDFQKEKFGKIPIFTTQVTGYNIKGVPMNFKLALRNDPRQSEVNVVDKINILNGKTVYFSFNESGNNTCDDGYVYVGLGMFMANLGFDVKSAVQTKQMAIEKERPHVDCTNARNNTAFLLVSSNQTRIIKDKDNQNCYYLEYTNCESLEVIERFEIATLASLTNAELPSARGEIIKPLTFSNLSNQY